MVVNSPYLQWCDKNHVNLNAWITPDHKYQNVGDYLSLVVVKAMCDKYGVDFCTETNQTRHLYAIGSILLGYQDATIWGSGFGYDNSKSKFFKADAFLHRHIHKLDIRAVRGPETRRILNSMGLKCPEIYGDPAVLLPLFYTPSHMSTTLPKKEYIVIPHYSKDAKYKGNENVLNTFVKDYKDFIDKLCSAKFVISSSLHGIILAEAYGIPAIMLKDTPSEDITKYKDWYYSTGRTNFKIARNVEQALGMNCDVLDVDVLKSMQNALIENFPIDLWSN